MASGTLRGAPAGLLASVCALLVGIVLATPAAASSSARPDPPTAAELQRATRQTLRDPAYRSSPADALRRGGGVTPGGGGSGDALFPKRRVVTLYGAPQLSATALGKRTPRGAARKVVEQAKPYKRLGDRRVVPGFDLIAVVATSTPGSDRKYRTRQSEELIAEYLKRVRAIGGRLVLDIQPGRSSVLTEIKALRKWIRQPDVDVAIDPEWNVGRRGVPGRTRGTIDARKLNRVSRELQRIVEDGNLPPKLMLVHQFSRTSVRHRAQIKQRPGVSATLNFDGIGSPAAKKAGYANLSREGLFNGFSVFYDLDTRVMKPRSILDLVPEVDFLLYQ